MQNDYTSIFQMQKESNPSKRPYKITLNEPFEQK